MKQIQKYCSYLKPIAMVATLSVSAVTLTGCDFFDFGGEAAASVSLEPMYYEVSPIVVNLGGIGSTRYLKVTPVLVTSYIDLYEQFDKKTPLVRNTMINLLREETAETLLAKDGFETTRQKAITELREVLLRDTGVQALGDVLFSEFVVQ